MKTYVSKNGKPVIRSCANCVHFSQISQRDARMGYCKVKPLMFAYTMKYNVYAIVKSFCLCKDHFFKDEESLMKTHKVVEMIDILINKNELEKNR
jgi:hypothetical protein